MTKLTRPETTQLTCTAGSVFVFEHSPLAQASALDRKKKRDKLTLVQQGYVYLCPNSMIACAVPGIDGTYEVSLHLVRLNKADMLSALTPRLSWNHAVVVSMVNFIIMALWTMLVQDLSKFWLHSYK